MTEETPKDEQEEPIPVEFSVSKAFLGSLIPADPVTAPTQASPHCQFQRGPYPPYPQTRSFSYCSLQGSHEHPPY